VTDIVLGMGDGCFPRTVGYYRHFIKNYGVIAEPLMKLLQKDGLCWTEEASAALRALQQTLTSAPVLQLPNFDCAFIIECDASGAGLGMVLHQDSGPVAFFNRRLAPHHTKLAAYEHELIGLVQAVRHRRSYLGGGGEGACLFNPHRSFQFEILAVSTLVNHPQAPVGKLDV
jgi:hypothetical protein